MSARRLAAGLSALLAAGAAAAQLGPAPREPNVLRYVARIEPNIATGFVKGLVTIRLDTTAEDAAAFAFDAGDLEIDSVRESGAAVQFVKLDRRLVVTLSTARAAAGRRDIEIAYHGTPRRGIAFSPQRRATLARLWWRAHARPM